VPEVSSAPERALRIDRPRRILVIRALQLGDLLCVVPALRALRTAFPGARIALAGLPWAREFVARYSRYLDEFIEFPGFPGLPERDCDPRRVPHFLSEVQGRRFDLALQLHGSGRLLNPLTMLLGARQCAGFCPEAGDCPDSQRFLAWRDAEHEVLRYVRLIRELGIAACGTDLEFPLGREDREAAGALLAESDLRGMPYVCLHAGSQLPSRRWPPERFAAVADRLAALGYRIVVTGTAAERALTAQVGAAMRHTAIDLAGRTSLGALGALIESAALLLSNDTGVSHIAAALRTPSVVVCCGSDYRRWAPLDCARHRVLHHAVDCRPCRYRVCPIGHPCATGVPVAQVADEAERVLHEYSAAYGRHACAG
jgi:ADP-heptose:LPS heptosyltransferase